MIRLRIFVLCALMVALFAGCKTTEYRWVTKDGLPATCSNTFKQKHYTFTYCLTQDGDEGKWYVEGVAKPTALGATGNYTDADFYIYMVSGKSDVVKKVKMYSQGFSIDKGVMFHKEFECDRSFDWVAFGYNVKYRY